MSLFVEKRFKYQSLQKYNDQKKKKKSESLQIEMILL